MVDSTLANKLQWNFNRNWNIFIHENAFENIACELASILSQYDPIERNCLQQHHIWDRHVDVRQGFVSGERWEDGE